MGGGCVLLCCCLLANSLAGCRALRCSEPHDAALAAARRQSLLARDAQQRGQWEQAEALFASAVEQCPADERARHGYAQSLWQRGAQDEAVAHMEEAVRRSGNDPERMVELGGMYLHRGELPRAGQQADRAIAANPQLAGAWALRGQTQQALGQREAALASFHRALSLRANDPPVQLAVAAIYAQQNRPQRALATLQALADSYPPDQVPAEVLIQEAYACRALGRHADAAARLAQATERSPPPGSLRRPPPESLRGTASAELYYELARAHLEAGNTSAARLAVQAALARNPAHAGSQALAHELAPQGGIIASADVARPTRVQ
jgi:tetratricopeptide (TPR) repeat protein